jgi:hypothetical protein
VAGINGAPGTLGTLARGTGFPARFLVAWPERARGTRLFEKAPPEWPARARIDFHDAVGRDLTPLGEPHRRGREPPSACRAIDLSCREIPLGTPATNSADPVSRDAGTTRMRPSLP